MVRDSVNAEQVLLRQGAKTVVVPGIPPLGCMPPNLVFFPSNESAGYEPSTGCLKGLNDIARHHNSELQKALDKVRANHRSEERRVGKECLGKV